MSRARDIANLQSSKITADAGIDIDNITLEDNDISTTNSNGNLTITPNGTGDLQVNSDRIKVRATEGESATLVLAADEDDDGGDTWKIISNTDNTFVIQNDISNAADVTHFSITPANPVANSVAAFAGKATFAGSVSITGNNLIVDNGYGISTVGGLKYIADSDGDAPSGGLIHNFYTDNGSTSALVIAKSGNVAIGDTNVNYRLLVHGTDGSDSGDVTTRIEAGTVSSNSAVNHSTLDLTARSKTSGGTAIAHNVEIRSVGDASGNGGTMAFYTDNTSAAITERMRIDSSGKVGIGITPLASTTGNGLGAAFSTLAIKASDTVTQALSIDATNAAGPNFMISSYSDGSGSYYMLGANLLLDTSGNNAWETNGENMSGIMLDSRGGNGIQFITAAHDGSSYVPDERMRINNSGNVGISTNDPQFKLHVNKGSNDYAPSGGVTENIAGFQTNYDSAGSQIVTLAALDGNWIDGTSGADSSSGWLWGYGNNVRGGLVYDHRGTERMQMFSSYGAISFITPDAADGDGVPTDSNMNERLVILPGGNVGIGASPSAPLDVRKNNPSSGRVAVFGSNGTTSTDVGTGISNTISITRTRISVPANTTTNLLSGYGGSMALITILSDSGVPDVQATFMVTHAWSSASQLFVQSYGSNTPTFTWSAASGVLKLNHNHSGTLLVNVASLIVPSPGAG